MSEKSTSSENDNLMFSGWTVDNSEFDFDDHVGKNKGTKPAKKPGLDIFDEMKNADLKNLDYLNQQTPEMASTFSPLVAMRWFSTVADSSPMRDYHLILTNEIMNLNFWNLKDYPDLQWKLMAACGSGKVQRHQWLAMSQRKKISKLQQFFLQWYPSANDDELNMIINSMNRDDFENFVKSTGATDDELKTTLDTYDKETGSKPEKARKTKK
jgi:hypothetical protein